MVLKTTFGQSQRWSLIRGKLGVENEENNNFKFTNKVFNGKDVLILGGLNPLLILCYSDINELVYYKLLYTIKMTEQTYRNK